MMRPSPQCCWRQAVHRVILVRPTKQTSRPHSSSASTQQQQVRPRTSHLQIRLLNTRPPRGPNLAEAAKEQLARRDRAFDHRYTTRRDIERSGRDRPPRDHEITDPQIMLIDDGAPKGPLSTRLVLDRLRAHESLRMITPYVPADSADGQPQYAVCKLVDKKQEYERQKQAKERKSQSANNNSNSNKTKELEMTWAIGQHDLAIKMRRLAGFLAKGLKVEVLVARKKGGKKVDGEEAEAVLRRIRDEMEAIGAREGKPATGNPGGTMRMFLIGK